jgi:predicted acetyltransferase
MEDSVRLRAATDADRIPIADLLFHVFHDTITDELREQEIRITEFDRSVVADDDGTVVGHATAQTREVTVPGAVLPAAHVTAVGVAPTHRRRGILTAMMRKQLSQVAEPIAILWASETAIYPRFGYGAAGPRMSFEVMTREVRFQPAVPPAGRLRLIVPKEAQAELAAVYDTVRPGRIGWSSRSDNIWHNHLEDLESSRHGATDLRGVICDGPDGPTGYALWRVANNWDAYGPNAQVRVKEVITADQATYAALWQFLLGIDLARSLRYDLAAPDEPLQYLVDEPRRLGRTCGDALWVRIVDLPAALEARSYLTPIDAVFEVTDTVLPQNAGRWRLSGGPGKVTCTRTDDAPDLACSIADLGAVYLGGTTLAALAEAGRVERLTGNLPTVAFGADRPPNPIEVF